MSISELLENKSAINSTLIHEVLSPIVGIEYLAMYLEEILRDIKKVHTNISNNQDDLHYVVVHKTLANLLLFQIHHRLKDILSKACEALDIALMLRPHSSSEPVYISNIIQSSLIDYHVMFNNQLNVTFNINEDFYYIGSKSLIKHIMFNLFNNIKQYGGNNINICIDTTKIYFIMDKCQDVSKEIWSSLFEALDTKSKMSYGVGLAFCRIVMRHIGGDIRCITHPKVQFILIFPQI